MERARSDKGRRGKAEVHEELEDEGMENETERTNENEPRSK